MKLTLTSPEPNLAHLGSASQSQVLWSYGPELAVDGREETCSYTTTGTTGPGGQQEEQEEGRQARWWRLSLGSLTSVGRVSLSLAGAGQGQEVQVVVYLLTGREVRHCHPLQGAGGDSDRRRLVTDCTGEENTEHCCTLDHWRSPVLSK